MQRLVGLVAVLLMFAALALVSGCGGGDSSAQEEPAAPVVTVPPAVGADPQPPTSADPTVGNGKIVFASQLEGPAVDLYVVEPDGSGLLNLTNTSDAAESWPSWSGDGSMLAFTKVDGERPFRVYTMRSDGTEVTRLVDVPGVVDFSPSFSPDGSEIAFVRKDPYVGGSLGDIFVVAVEDRTVSALTDDGLNADPDFSPDGGRIVYVAPRDPSRFEVQTIGSERVEVWVMNADGSDKTRLTDDGVRVEHPRFSPDGSKIVFASNRDGDGSDFDIFVMNADGSGIVNLTNSDTYESEPAWSPDGSRIVFVARPGNRVDLMVMNADGAERAVLLEEAAYAPLKIEPAWQPLLASAR